MEAVKETLFAIINVACAVALCVATAGGKLNPIKSHSAVTKFCSRDIIDMLIPIQAAAPAVGVAAAGAVSTTAKTVSDLLTSGTKGEC